MKRADFLIWYSISCCSLAPLLQESFKQSFFISLIISKYIYNIVFLPPKLTLGFRNNQEDVVCRINNGPIPVVFLFHSIPSASGPVSLRPNLVDSKHRSCLTFLLSLSLSLSLFLNQLISLQRFIACFTLQECPIWSDFIESISIPTPIIYLFLSIISPSSRCCNPDSSSPLFPSVTISPMTLQSISFWEALRSQIFIKLDSNCQIVPLLPSPEMHCLPSHYMFSFFFLFKLLFHLKNLKCFCCGYYFGEKVPDNAATFVKRRFFSNVSERFHLLNSADWNTEW